MTQGFEVVRYWNNEVFENMAGVLETIRARLLAPLPLPPLTLPQQVGEGKRKKVIIALPPGEGRYMGKIELKLINF